MKHARRFQLLSTLVVLFVFLGSYTLLAWTAVPVEDDPLARMPGTQPGAVTTLEGPNRCFNCHAGFDEAVEPGFNWMGSMMAQASRDFLFWACMTVADQDSIWALGNPNAADLCERCHFPKGWLEGRSDPPNASAMTGTDYDGVQCDFCHNMYNPFFEATQNEAREGDLNGNGTIDPDEWVSYWDETNLSETPSDAAAATTYTEDALLAQTITFFNGDPFFGADNQPVSPNYTENGAGQYFVSPGGDKRASFTDATGRHDMLYSRYHKSRDFCNSCHDVSNPALANLSQDGSTPLTTETEAAFSYYHIERTSSEFLLSDYGKDGGSPGIGPYAPDIFATSHSGNAIATCQDCHMPDTLGKASSMSDAVVRPDGSVEHPQSGQPVHDLTGGNMWVGYILASTAPKSPNYDTVNEGLLGQGPDILTLDLGAGDGFDYNALLAGVNRASQQLVQAAAIEYLTYDPASGAVTFRIQNHTGHKLISGFPEGRRMFVGVRIYAGGELLYEVNPYDATIGTLKGLPAEYSSSSPDLAAGESYVDELVYELHPSSTLTGESSSFHFVLADGRHKDNRIPPKGFRIDLAADRLSEPVWHGVSAPDYFTAEEYLGGYDAVDLTDYGISISGGDLVEVKLYYQTTSREYVEFLRDEINGTGTTLPESAYIIHSDPFFDQLKAWGDTVWQLWEHNKDLPGAAPVLMTEASVEVGSPPQVQFVVGSQDVSEGVGTVTVTVEATATSSQEITVPYTISGTATGSGVDHNLDAGTFTIAAGSLTGSVPFQVTSDTLYERAETIIVTLGEPSHATLGSPTEQIITIVDDDSPPTVSFSSPTYAQSEGGGPAVITVTLSGDTALTAVVQYSSSDGSASSADYTPVNGSLSFSPGVKTQTFSVPILDDDLVEGDETVLLSLSDPVSATMGVASAELTIVDNEGEPTLSIVDASAGEGDGTMVFDIILSFSSGVDVSVNYAAHDGPAGPGGAVAGEDYASTVGTLEILAGSTQGQISVPILQDDLYEGDEGFTVELNSPVHASVADAVGQGTIIDDESPPVIAFGALEYGVDENVAAGLASIDVTLTGATALTATVNYQTSDGSAGPEDYTAISGALVFTPGVTTRTFAVAITDDGIDELDETVLLSLAGAVDANLGLDTATLTIRDDDSPSSLSIGDVSMMEADSAMLFPVNLSAPSGLDIQVTYATSNGTDPASAIAGDDYQPANGTLNIHAGTSTAFVSVDILDDPLYEYNETFLVTLSGPVNATLGDPEAVGTILNNDAPPQIEFEKDEYTIGEADATVTLTVTLSGLTELGATVQYETMDGSPPAGASAGEDYVQDSGTLTFLPGESSKTIVIAILNDDLPEVTETFVVTLSGATASSLGSASSASVRIVDDEAYRTYLPLVLRDVAP
jgi:hypothetical protein